MPARPPSNTADAVAAFRQTCTERVQTILPPAPSEAVPKDGAAADAPAPLPVVIGAVADSRLGVQTVRRRRLTARGTNPVGAGQHRVEKFYRYGAIAPSGGDGYGMPNLTADRFQLFLDRLAATRPETLNVLLVDTSRCHTAHALPIPPTVRLVFQEPDAPELNPAERGWQALKDEVAWQCFPDLAGLQARVVEVVQDWDAAMLQSLTAYPCIMDAINALSP